MTFMTEPGLPLDPEALAIVERIAYAMADGGNRTVTTLETVRKFGGVDFRFLNGGATNLGFALKTDNWCASFYRNCPWDVLSPKNAWGEQCQKGVVKGDVSQFRRDIIFAAMAI